MQGLYLKKNTVYSFCNHLDKVPSPTIHVSWLKAIGIEAYTCKTKGNPDYINVILRPPNKPHNLRDGSRTEQWKV